MTKEEFDAYEASLSPEKRKAYDMAAKQLAEEFCRIIDAQLVFAQGIPVRLDKDDL